MAYIVPNRGRNNKKTTSGYITDEAWNQRKIEVGIPEIVREAIYKVEIGDKNYNDDIIWIKN